MLELLFILLLGMFIGYFFKWTGKLTILFQKAQTMLLFVIIFLMGCKIGIDEKVSANLHTIGIKAFLMALGAIGGSIFFTYLLLRLFSFQEKGDEGKYDR